MKPVRTIVFIWLAWALLLLGFQKWVTMRFEPNYPDRSQEWTTFETVKNYQAGQKYLTEPFMNQQVAWDSEYYLAIAVGGYDDPATDLIGPADRQVTKSYAFFPLYPWMMRLLAWFLSPLGLNPIAAATLAGVVLSGLGALGGLLALFDLTREALGEDGALRATFYLLIFPTGFFLLQVYTEGLFVGLAFGCLAMLNRRQWWWAALFAIGATLTRAVGVALIVPMFMVWVRSGDWYDIDVEWKQIFHSGVPFQPLVRALLVFSPLITFLIWKSSYLGLAFDFVQANFFGRSYFSPAAAFMNWVNVLQIIRSGDVPASAAYFMLEVGGLVLGLAACFSVFRSHPELAWFSLLVILISWGSGQVQGIQRYILGAPAVFVALARWGRNPVFDRAWTILSLLLMAVLAALFSFDMWVA